MFTFLVYRKIRSPNQQPYAKKLGRLLVKDNFEFNYTKLDKVYFFFKNDSYLKNIIIQNAANSRVLAVYETIFAFFSSPPLTSPNL